ncbi:MAG: hemolysin family protein [Gemmataceae bacterium]
MPLLFGANDWAWTAIGLISIPALIALNGFFVAAEFALVSVRKTRVEEMVRLGLRGAKTVETALNRLDRSIAATQLGITLASIALGMVSEPSLAHLFQPLFEHLPPPFDWLSRHSIATVLAFALITYLHVVFGELMPKSMALQSSERFAVMVAGPLLLFSRLTRPVIVLMNFTGNRMLRWLGFRPASGEESVHSVEELLLLIEDTEEAGILEPEQAELVENVFRLSDKKVRDCMLPREKMAALELNTPPEKILEKVREGAHTRMPVYDGELDRIVGVVNTKNLFHLFSLRGVVVLDDAIYPAIFLEPDEDLGTALQLFRKSRKPMAMVRDPDGKILGLLTLEDVLEELVGELEDEHDRPMKKVRIRRRRKPEPGRGPAAPK